jgi:hypothetical protein
MQRMASKRHSEQRPLSKLFGWDGSSIQWKYTGALFLAFISADIVFQLRVFITQRQLAPVWIWGGNFLGSLVLVFGTVLLLRLFVNEWLVAGMCSLVYAGTTITIRWIFFPVQLDIILGLVFSFLWALLMLSMLKIILPRVNCLWFAMMSGYLLATLVDHLLVLTVILLLYPRQHPSFNDQVHLLLFEIGAALIFATMNKLCRGLLDRREI